MNATAHPAPNLGVLLDVPVRLAVELGACELPVREVLLLAPGSIVRLDKETDAPVDLYVNGKRVACGEVVVVEDQFGIKITSLSGQ